MKAVLRGIIKPVQNLFQRHKTNKNFEMLCFNSPVPVSFDPLGGWGVGDYKYKWSKFINVISFSQNRLLRRLYTSEQMCDLNQSKWGQFSIQIVHFVTFPPTISELSNILSRKHALGHFHCMHKQLFIYKHMKERIRN